MKARVITQDEIKVLSVECWHDSPTAKVFYANLESRAEIICYFGSHENRKAFSIHLAASDSGGDYTEIEFELDEDLSDFIYFGEILKTELFVAVFSIKDIKAGLPFATQTLWEP